MHVLTHKSDLLSYCFQAQDPQFSSPVELNNITLGEEQQSTQKRKRTKFTPGEDKVLIQAWLIVPKNAAAEANQRVDSFWLRIKNNYNEHRGHFKPRGVSQIKSRWHKLNSIVHKFVGCYKVAFEKKKSDSSKFDIMGEAYTLYYQDEGEQFKLEHAWRLLKDEPKWSNTSFEGGSKSKRTKISASGAYSTTSNLDTPSSCEYNAASPTVVCLTGTEVEERKGKSKSEETSSVVCLCQTGTEVEKGKEKSKLEETSSANVELIEVNEIPKTKVLVMAEMARVQDEQNKLKEKELNLKEREFELEFLFKDISGMTARQQRDHEMLCNVIREKYGIM